MGLSLLGRCPGASVTLSLHVDDGYLDVATFACETRQQGATATGEIVLSIPLQKTDNWFLEQLAEGKKLSFKAKDGEVAFSLMGFTAAKEKISELTNQ